MLFLSFSALSTINALLGTRISSSITVYDTFFSKILTETFPKYEMLKCLIFKSLTKTECHRKMCTEHEAATFANICHESDGEMLVRQTCVKFLSFR